MSVVSPRESVLPSKLFFRIGEVASLVGVEPHVLRYWEREFRSIRPTKSAKGQRVYSRKDVENLLRVRDLLYRDGFTIAGAKKRLQRSPAEAAAESEAAESVTAASTGEASRASAESADHARETVRELDGESDHDRRQDDRHQDEEEILSPGPESDPRLQPACAEPAPSRGDPVVQSKLAALRAEVEAFLNELEAGA